MGIESPDKRERALWLADKLVGDYGSEAAQLLRYFAASHAPRITCEKCGNPTDGSKACTLHGERCIFAPSTTPRKPSDEEYIADLEFSVRQCADLLRAVHWNVVADFGTTGDGLQKAEKVLRDVEYFVNHGIDSARSATPCSRNDVIEEIAGETKMCEQCHRWRLTDVQIRDLKRSSDGVKQT